jgi:hypothetical protein
MYESERLLSPRSNETYPLGGMRHTPCYGLHHSMAPRTGAGKRQLTSGSEKCV